MADFGALCVKVSWWVVNLHYAETFQLFFFFQIAGEVEIRSLTEDKLEESLDVSESSRKSNLKKKPKIVNFITTFIDVRVEYGLGDRPVSSLDCR